MVASVFPLNVTPSRRIPMSLRTIAPGLVFGSLDCLCSPGACSSPVSSRQWQQLVACPTNTTLSQERSRAPQGTSSLKCLTPLLSSPRFSSTRLHCRGHRAVPRAAPRTPPPPCELRLTIMSNSLIPHASPPSPPSTAELNARTATPTTPTCTPRRTSSNASCWSLRSSGLASTG